MHLVKDSIGEVGPLLGMIYTGEDVLCSTWLNECHLSISWCGFAAISRGSSVAYMRLQQPNSKTKESQRCEEVSIINTYSDNVEDHVCALQWVDCELFDQGENQIMVSVLVNSL